MSKIFIENIWAEDLFKWFYENVTDSGGDGAAAIVCKNYKEVAGWFTEWWRKEIRPKFENVNVQKRDFWHPKSETDNIINFHDANENFMFTNNASIFLHQGDYVFIVLEDCNFSFEPSNSSKKILAIS